MSRLAIVLLILFQVLMSSACSSGDGSGNGGGDDDVTDPDPSEFPSAGVPDQNSMSISASQFNPHALSIDGVEVTITARLADQLNNNKTIPDGTAVYFAAEGGSIQETCTTTEGVCSVSWFSQDPRPGAGPVIADPLGSADQIYSYSAHRATLLIWSLGSESFVDNNSNGLFDEGDTQVDDNPEAFMDKNENGVRDVDEEFVNFPLPELGSGGTYDSADGLYSGSDCAHSSLCASEDRVFIFENVELVMSSNSVCIIPVLDAGLYWEPWDNKSFPVTLGSPTRVHFLIHDCFGNPPMNGTSISFEATAGDIFSDSGVIPNTNIDMGYAVSVSPAFNDAFPAGTRHRYPKGSLVYSASVFEDPANTDPEYGFLTFEVTLPGGSTRSITYSIYDPV